MNRAFLMFCWTWKLPNHCLPAFFQKHCDFWHWRHIWRHVSRRRGFCRPRGWFTVILCMLFRKADKSSISVSNSSLHKTFNLEHFIRLLWHNGPNANKIRYMKTHDRDEACKCFGGESATRFATWGSNARHVTSRCKLNAAGDCFTQCHTWSLFPTIITSYLRIGFAQYLGSMLFTARSVNKRKFIPTIPNSFKSMSRTIKIKVKVKGKGISL